MLCNDVLEILLIVANRYNLQLKCSCDTERCSHFLIKEERKVRAILKNIKRHYKDCRNYYDFLYNLAIYLEKKGR